MPVAVGDDACVDDLREIASMPDRVLSCGVNEDPSKLGRKLLRGNYSIANFFLSISVLYSKCCLEGQGFPQYTYFFLPKIRVTAQLCVLVFWLYNRILRL